MDKDKAAAPLEEEPSKRPKTAECSESLWGGDGIATLDEIQRAQTALMKHYKDTVLRTPLVLLTVPLPIAAGAQEAKSADHEDGVANRYMARAYLPFRHNTCTSHDAGGGAPAVSSPTIYLKLEGLQTTGSFKVRGMQYKMHCSDMAQLKSSGVVTMSAGNAGKAVAHLARANGVPAKIIMPASAPDDRKQLLESYGAVVEKTPTHELLNRVAEVIRQENRVFIHPFDDVDIIRGHGSCGLEIMDQFRCMQPPQTSNQPDLVVVCCGGGGLLAGVAAAVKQNALRSMGPCGTAAKMTRVVGVEPVGAQSMYLSLKHGSEHQWCPGPPRGKTDTIAHGLAPPFAGKACFNHVKEFVDEVVLVSDEELRAATRFLFEAGVVAEVSGAAAVAAVLSGKCGSPAELAGQHIVCVVSGRNIELEEFVEEVGAAGKGS